MKYSASALAWALCLAGVGACTSSGGVQGHFTAVHDTMVTLGSTSSGTSLKAPSARARHGYLPMELEARCYTFVAFGGDGARDIDVSLLDGQNASASAATPRTRRPRGVSLSPARAGATCSRCAWPRAAARTSWAPGRAAPPTGAAGGGASEVVEGTCAAPMAIQPDRP